VSFTARDPERKFAGEFGNDRDAPIPAVRQLTPEPHTFDPKAALPHARPANDAVSSMLHPSVPRLRVVLGFFAVLAV
jgi:hypothetical protein